MENMGYLTPSDVMCMTKHHNNSGMAATGIGLGAGLGGGALLLAIGLGWGINQASKARARAAEQANQANANTTNLLTQFLIAERQCQHNWQLANTPTISQMVDVRSTSQQGQQSASTSTAAADALAIAAAINAQQGGINSAIGNCGYLRVQRYSAPQPCGCDTCACGN